MKPPSPLTKAKHAALQMYRAAVTPFRLLLAKTVHPTISPRPLVRRDRVKWKEACESPFLLRHRLIPGHPGDQVVVAPQPPPHLDASCTVLTTLLHVPSTTATTASPRVLSLTFTLLPSGITRMTVLEDDLGGDANQAMHRVPLDGVLVADALTATTASTSTRRPTWRRDDTMGDDGERVIRLFRTDWPDTGQPHLELYLGLGSHGSTSTDKPFRFTMYGISGCPTLCFNARSLFHFEAREVDPKPTPHTWRDWTDTMPYGHQAFSVDFTFPGAHKLYGLPTHTTAMALPPTTTADRSLRDPYRLYNSDVFGYDVNDTFPLYAAVPFAYAHQSRRGGETTGIFLHNGADTYVDVAYLTEEEVAVPGMIGTPTPMPSTQWVVEAGCLDFFLLTEESPHALLDTYYTLTGRPVLPPKWSLGYHQCRWHLDESADNVTQIDANFDRADMPLDVIWVDIEHTDGKKYTTWDHSRFPDPQGLQDALAGHHRRMVAIVDPHLKVEETFDLYREARDRQLLVRDRDGHEFQGACWPGNSAYPDWTDPTTRAWWSDRMQYDAYQGSTPSLFIWNDMNEPSVFDGPEISLDRDARHLNGQEHRELHNVFGFFYHMATVQGIQRRGEEERDRGGVPGGGRGTRSSSKSTKMGLGLGTRPFVLSRAGFAGSQRLGPLWTGDNQAGWSHLASSVPQLLTLSTAGLPWVGADVGGFFGNPEPELLERWYQLGCYYPFFRGHSNCETKRREPYLLPEPARSRVRTALRWRYHLLPYLYTQTWRSTLPRHERDRGEVFEGNGGGSTVTLLPTTTRVLDAGSTSTLEWTYTYKSTTIPSATDPRYGLCASPLWRPLWYMHPRDRAVTDVEEAFYCGDALLVVPIAQRRCRRRRVRLPRNVFYRHLDSGVRIGHFPGPHEDGDGDGDDGTVVRIDVEADRLPVLVREGSVVPLSSTVGRHVKDGESFDLDLVVACDARGDATGVWYDDDGETMAFARRQAWRTGRVEVGGGRLSWSPETGTGGEGEDHGRGSETGLLPRPVKVARVVLLGVDPDTVLGTEISSGGEVEVVRHVTTRPSWMAVPRGERSEDETGMQEHVTVLELQGAAVDQAWSVGWVSE